MIHLRPYEDRHAEALAGLMLGLARSMGSDVAASEVEEELVEQAKLMDILLASEGNRLAGYATFTTQFPTGALKSFTYIQQVYVAEDARRMGVARRLMEGVARISQDRGSRRMEWSTSGDNRAACALYDGLGAVGSDNVQYVLQGEALDRLAAPRYAPA